MTEQNLSVERKALCINLDSSKYGTFAEIGAGQEVARHFFQAGGAAGTVAKTISAYDMKFSDAIYGEAGRYVSRKRLVQMMAHEYDLLDKRLSKARGQETTFFAFSNNKADINILEVGLGGRLDATNTTNKNLISIITSIGMDHKEFLGNNLSAIAKEKVGIIKKKTKVISSKQSHIVRDIILRKTKEQNSKCLMYGEDWKVQGNTFLYNDFKINLSNLSLEGSHQYINASVAILACLISKELEIENLKLENSINKIKWPGRLHKLRGKLSKKYKDLEHEFDRLYEENQNIRLVRNEGKVL